MKNLIRILIIFIMILAAGQIGYAQTSASKADSLKLRNTKSQTTESVNDQETKGNMGGDQGSISKQQAGKNNVSQSVKRIRGGRPDMTRARGARPPLVVRPSGSGIPKGVGKPGGAGRKGGR